MQVPGPRPPRVWAAGSVPEPGISPVMTLRSAVLVLREMGGSRPAALYSVGFRGQILFEAKV